MPTNHPYTIQKLQAQNLQLARTLFEKYLYDDEQSLVSHTDAYLFDLLSKDSFYAFVALDGEKVIGGLTAYEMDMYKFEGREVYLYEIEVDEKYRKLGVGSSLIEALKNHAKSRNAKLIFVGTETNNLPARALYSKLSKNSGTEYIGFDIEV